VFVLARAPCNAEAIKDPKKYAVMKKRAMSHNAGLHRNVSMVLGVISESSTIQEAICSTFVKVH
jgi:hypothetical protein